MILNYCTVGVNLKALKALDRTAFLGVTNTNGLKKTLNLTPGLKNVFLLTANFNIF